MQINPRTVVYGIDCPFDITGHLAGGFEQVEVSRLSLLFPFGVIYGQHPTFGNPGVVMKTDDPDTGLLAAFHQPGQHTYGIPEQRRISWIMNITFNTGAVNTNFSALFYFLVSGLKP